MNLIEKFSIKDIKQSSFDLSLLENCEKQIESISDFLNGANKIFLLGGFLGSGKTSLIDFISQNLNDGVLSIKYTCCETTVLDDMLLSFFDSLRELTISGKIEPLKVKIENFTQKINFYFNSINKPIVIFLDGFSNILKENKSQVLNFIKHLSTFENVKIIIVSRVFNYEDFEDCACENSTVLPLSKDLFEKYLKSNDIKNIGVLSQELYKQTKGYFLYVNLSLKIMKLRGYNLGKFLEVFSKSMLNFPDFILREALLFIDPVSLHLFRLLAVMRIPIRINLLKTFNIYNEEQVKFFIENSLLANDNGFLYIPDYFREIIERQIQDSVMLKLHKACVELYETQLPLKPLERDLRLSRQTMRNEIEYHSMFLPKKPVILPAKEQIEVKSEPAQQPKQIHNTETKEEKIKKINFIVEDENILNDIADSIKDFVDYRLKNKEFVDKTNTLSLTQLINAAHKQEQNYEYKTAIVLYQTALTKKEDKNFDTFLPSIYLKLANAYKNLSKWFEALEYYNKAQDWYYNVSDNQKVCEIKLEIANIYFETYKQDNAKYILKELEKTSDISDDLRIKVNIALGKLTNNIDEEYNYYKKSLEIAGNNIDKFLLAELYYRFAVVCDEKDDIKSALNYYKKCVDIIQKPEENKFLSKSLSNIAQIYDESAHSDIAIKYYQKCIELDTDTKNYNGLYSSFRALAEIYASRDEKKSLMYLEKALECAKFINEVYYITDTLLEIANFYLLRNNYDKSYEYYKSAYQTSKNQNSGIDINKIEEKIKYLEDMKNGNR